MNAAFGPVVAWNILLFGAIVGAGLLTYGWLRALTLSQAPRPSAAWPSPSRRTGWSRAPAICWGGLRCSYRWPCSPSSARVTPGRRVHAWGALAAAATISIPLSGQLHLALGAVPFIVAYAAVRFGLLSFVWTLGGAAVAVGIGLAVRYTLIAGSAEEAGRSSAELRRYSAEPVDFLNRWHEPRSRSSSTSAGCCSGWPLPDSSSSPGREEASPSSWGLP